MKNVASNMTCEQKVPSRTCELCPYNNCHHDLEIYIEVDPWNILHIKVNNKKLS